MSATLFKLLFLGFLLTFVGIVVLIVAAALQGNTNVSISGVLIVFVGLFPIILGVGPYTFWAFLLAVVLTIVGFVVFFWLRRATRA